MPALEENSIIVRETAFRQRTLKAVTALSIAVASLLLFLVFPLLPRELMVLFAVILGVLAYQAPTLALVLMLLLGIPGYLYQLGSGLPAGAGLPIPLVAIVSAILLLVAVAAGESHEPLGMVAGTGAALLMLTPFHYLSLPVIIGVILFRTRGVKKRAAGAIVTFAVLYYPILALQNGASPGGLVPIFDPVVFETRPPVAVLNLPEIFTKLSQVIDVTNTRSALPYLNNLANYWPLSLGPRSVPAGVIFCILSGAAIAAECGMLSLFHWLEKRETGHEYLPYAAPALSMLVGVLTFVALAIILALPLAIVNTLNIPALVLGTVVVGACSSLAEIWLRRRDRILNMRARLAERSGTMRTQTDFLMDRIRRSKAQCRLMDTGPEEALGQICQQELAFVEQTVTDLSLKDLEQKAALFEELQGKLSSAIAENDAKLYQYYDEDRQKYNDCLVLAQKYGFVLGQSVQGPDFSQLATRGYDEVLELQVSLNKSYQTSAQLLAKGIDKLEERLYSEVDSEFKCTGIHIARDYLAQERFSEALQEFLQELGDIEKILLETAAGLEKEVLMTLDGLKAIVADILMPTAINLGDAVNVNYYQEVIGKMGNLYDSPDENEVLPGLMRTVAKVGELGDIVADLTSRLAEKIGELEKNIQAKTPRGYNWGVDPEIRNRMAEISPTFRRASNPVGVHKRLSLIKGGPASLEPAARAVKDYSVAHELLINYTNIEHLVDERLNEAGLVSADDLPVKRHYSREYLELYCLKHPGEVCIETDTGMLTPLGEAKAANKTRSRK